MIVNVSPAPIADQAARLLKTVTSTGLDTTGTTSTLLSGISHLIENIGSPLFIPIELQDSSIIYSTLLSEPVESIATDVSALLNTSKRVSLQAVMTLNGADVIFDTVKNNLKSLETKLTNSEDSYGLSSGFCVGSKTDKREFMGSVFVVRDNLDAGNLIDLNRSSSITLTDTEAITLKRNDIVNLGRSAVIDIKFFDEKGKLIGIPGNNLECDYPD